MKLKGLNLQVVSIHRKGIFDMDAFAFCCENCGRVIINSAIVKDDNNKEYVIGLDCKKTLIDKNIIDNITANYKEWEVKYKVKDFKKEQSTITKVLAYLDNNKMTIEVSNNQNSFIVTDTTKENQFGTLGSIIYYENLGYLFKIGLKDILQNAVNKGIIKPSKY